MSTQKAVSEVVRHYTPQEQAVLQTAMDMALKINPTLTEKELRAIGVSFAQDALQPTVSTASVVTPIQFLQNWLPGIVHVITQIRVIDSLVPMSVIGSWEEESIVQGFGELTGGANLYGDYSNKPESSYNINYLSRTIVRFQQGLAVGLLESERSSRVNVDAGSMKRNAAALALEISRNNVGFSGFNGGNNATYGILNDPNLPNYVTVANGAAGSPTWASKTFLEITQDIITWATALRNNSGGNIDPKKTPIVMGVAMASVDAMSKTNTLGTLSVDQWLKQTYPTWRVESIPQFNAANSSANVAYVYADKIADDSTDDGRVFLQAVPTKFRFIGVQQRLGRYEEGYTNATAGIMLKRPWAVYRASGI
jgi:hypothetical protein